MAKQKTKNTEKCLLCGKKKDAARKFCSKKCSMKYRHSHKDEYASYFKSLRAGRIKRRKYDINCLQCGKKKKRGYHRFCSKECYGKYKISHKEEFAESAAQGHAKLRKVPDAFCKQCNSKIKHEGKRGRKFCCLKCFSEYKKSHKEEYVYSDDARQKARESFERFKIESKDRYDVLRKRSSDRWKYNNPSQNPESKKKIMESCKKYWNTHPKEKDERIKRFMNAPLRGRGKEWKPTLLEVQIMELDIPGLSYVGDGSLFVTIGCSRKRKKNPDFILKGKKKVVEVGDTNYWHTLDEIKQTVADYECIGYKCLYLTTKEMKSIDIYEPMVKDFVRDNK